MVTTETQQILELLRSRDAAPDDSVAGFRSLPALIASFEAIGLDIESVIALPDEAAVPVVEVTTYRVVQEALTNAHRYSTGRVSVATHTEKGNLHVLVENPRKTPPAEEHGSGFGLLGMRERLAAAGGSLTVEDRPDRFKVHAVVALNGRKLS